MCEAELYAAICEKLSMDTGPGGLVRLLLHAPEKGPDFDRIGRDTPDACGDKPAYLGIRTFNTQSLLDDSCVPVFRGFVRFRYCSCGPDADFRTIKIGDRIMSLLYGTAGPDKRDCPDNISFCDFSNCDVTVKSNTFVRRSRIDGVNDETDRWCESIDISLIWHCEPCPDCEHSDE